MNKNTNLLQKIRNVDNWCKWSSL